MPAWCRRSACMQAPHCKMHLLCNASDALDDPAFLTFRSPPVPFFPSVLPFLPSHASI